MSTLWRYYNDTVNALHESEMILRVREITENSWYAHFHFIIQWFLRSSENDWLFKNIILFELKRVRDRRQKSNKSLANEYSISVEKIIQ